MMAFINKNNIIARPGDHPTLKPRNKFKEPSRLIEKCSGLMNAYSQGTVNSQCNYKFLKRTIEHAHHIIPTVSDLFVERTELQGMISEKRNGKFVLFICRKWLLTKPWMLS